MSSSIKTVDDGEWTDLPFGVQKPKTEGYGISVFDRISPAIFDHVRTTIDGKRSDKLISVNRGLVPLKRQTRRYSNSPTCTLTSTSTLYSSTSPNHQRPSLEVPQLSYDLPLRWCQSNFGSVVAGLPNLKNHPRSSSWSHRWEHSSAESLALRQIG